MGQALAVEQRVAFDELGKRIAGMFERIAGERAQRFELADGVDPVAEKRAIAAAPRLDGPGELRAPEKERSDRREELIAARRPDCAATTGDP